MVRSGFLKIYFLSLFLFQVPSALADRQECFSLYKGTSAKETRIELAQGTASAAEAKQIQDYLIDTMNSIEQLRGENGLVYDTNWIRTQENKPATVQSLNENTSGTNVAIDLLIHSEIILRGIQINSATKTLERAMDTLTQLTRHPKSGLFFSWYSTKIKGDVKSYSLSSIDNLHLALALWTVAESFPNSKMGAQARFLFNSMDFSAFYDPRLGLIGGNFSLVGKKWVRDAYNFANIGSEARILYSVGWALGLFKRYDHLDSFVPRALQALTMEVKQTEQGSLLKLWDGSAFQLLFPKIFAGEEMDSPILNKMFQASGPYMVAEGIRRQLPVPAAHSPSIAKIISRDGEDTSFPIYNDKAGNKDLVSSFNQDIHILAFNREWDRTFTPYALFMAATSNPSAFLPILKSIQKIKSEKDMLYQPGLGWVDGYNVSGEHIGEVVPAQIAVNQGMIGLSLLQMGSGDGLSASGRALHSNSKINDRLKYFYYLLDRKLSKQIYEEAL